MTIRRPYAVAALLGALRGVGLFGLFLEQPGRRDRFGREDDGSPWGPWGCEDLD